MNFFSRGDSGPTPPDASRERQKEVRMGDLLNQSRTGEEWITLCNLLSGKKLYDVINYEDREEGLRNKPLTYQEFRKLFTTTESTMYGLKAEDMEFREVMDNLILGAIGEAETKK